MFYSFEFIDVKVENPCSFTAGIHVEANDKIEAIKLLRMVLKEEVLIVDIDREESLKWIL